MRGLAWLAVLGLCLAAGCERAQPPAPPAPGAKAPPGAEAAGEEQFARLRTELVDRYMTEGGRDALPGQQIKDERVLAAMRKVPRHKFVPPGQLARAYEDRPLPIGEDQTISQPSLVALMTELLQLKDDQKALEIGTGSGYQAAVLAELAREVYTIEILKPLADSAAQRLQALGYGNVHVRCGDGYQGWPEHAPFDAIIVTCAPDHVPQPLVDQLKVGGRMVIPVGEQEEWQTLVLLIRSEGGLVRKSVTRVRFVPMTGEAQGPKGK